MLDSILSFIGKGLDMFSSSSNADKQIAAQKEMAAQNIQLQKDFAQHGLSWKIDDAATKGIHPLVALGAQGSSFSPVSIGTSSKETDFGGMGQDLGRAIKAAISGEDREKADEAQARKLQLEKGALENDLLRTELRSKMVRSSAASGQVGPAMPANLTRVDIGRVPLPRPGPDRTISQGTAVKDDDIKQKEEDFPATKIVRPFGYPLYANPWFSDGQQFEDRYGDSEVGSTIKFGVNTVADHAYTGWRMLPSRGEPYGADRRPASEMRWRRRY